MRTAFIQVLLVFSISSRSAAMGPGVTHVKLAYVENTPSIAPSISLCKLMKNLRRYNGRLIRVQVIIRDTGGHYPFFIVAQGCDPESLVSFCIRFEPRDRTEAVFGNRLFADLHPNLASEHATAAMIIVGRVSKLRSGRLPDLLLSVKNVEGEDPE